MPEIRLKEILLQTVKAALIAELIRKGARVAEEARLESV